MSKQDWLFIAVVGTWLAFWVWLFLGCSSAPVEFNEGTTKGYRTYYGSR